MRRIVPTVVLLGLLIAAAAPRAADDPAAGPLWVTVNRCDTGSAPNGMGVRASLPGDGGSGDMKVQFTAQYFSTPDGAWKPVTGSGSSPVMSAGSSDLFAGQAGWDFRFDPPPAGQHFLVRALATLQWVEGGKVVRSTTRVTQAGVGGVDEGEPQGTSRGSCLIQ